MILSNYGISEGRIRDIQTLVEKEIIGNRFYDYEEDDDDLEIDLTELGLDL